MSSLQNCELSRLDSDLSDPTDDDVECCMTDKHKKRLQSQLVNLVDGVIIKELLLHIFSADGIKAAQFDELYDLCENGKKRDATIKFFLILPTRGFNAFFLFCESLIFTGTPWLCRELLKEDQEWDTLNRVRKKRHERDNTLASYFEIPRRVTEEQLRDLQKKQHLLDLNEDDFLNQTTPKQVATVESATPPKRRKLESETCSVAVQESTEAEQTIPKQMEEPEEAAASNNHPLPTEGEGTIEADSSPKDDGEPGWVRKLYKYQRELAEPGINGFNYIINAPTGSGKTWTAAYIIRDHLQKVGKTARIVFFCPKTDLVKQQCAELEKRFPKHDVNYLIGEEAHEKSKIEVMIRFTHIVVATPAVVNNALENTKLPEKDRLTLDKLTLMVFDECHHTDRNHPYNKIMTKYIDIKIKDKDAYQRLPQVIGMTASLGVGQARADDEAVQFVLHKCANMDVSQIKTVTENKEELAEKSNVPFEENVPLEERPDDPFQKEILTSMTTIENRVKEELADETGSIKNLLEFPERKHTQIYRVMLSEIKQRLDNRPARLIVLPCLEYLMAYCWALNMYREARPTDAVVILQRKVKSRRRGRVDEKNKPKIEEWLDKIYLESLGKLEILSKDPTLVNPRLEKMKEYILDYFEDNEDSYCLLFTETRISTEALKGWINDDPDLKKYNADRITGHSSEENYGITNKKQESVLQSFKDGKHRILVATSVAEEGLDIQACNLVIRYNYSTNEVGRVQTKGRARQKDSTMANFVSVDHKEDVKGKEKLNFFREGLMKSAVRSIQKISTESYMKTIQQFQLHDAKDRKFKLLLKEAQAKSKSTNRLLMVCFGCRTNMCYSDEIVTFDSGTKHICINSEFDQRIKIEKHTKAGKYIDRFLKGNKVFCRNPDCRYDIGVVFTYELASFPTVKADAFRFYSMKSNGEKDREYGTFKKWDKTPVQYSEISEEDLLTVFKGKTYEPEDDKKENGASTSGATDM